MGDLHRPPDPHTCVKCGDLPGDPDAEPAEYRGMCALCAWMKWSKDSGNADFWASVACIECELGRCCIQQPRCANAEDCEDCADRPKKVAGHG